MQRCLSHSKPSKINSFIITISSIFFVNVVVSLYESSKSSMLDLIMNGEKNYVEIYITNTYNIQSRILDGIKIIIIIHSEIFNCIKLKMLRFCLNGVCASPPLFAWFLITFVIENSKRGKNFRLSSFLWCSLWSK